MFSLSLRFFYLFVNTKLCYSNMSGLEIMQVVGRQASENTKYHVLYGYYFLGLSKAKLSEIYSKNKPTIGNWITQYENEGSVSRQANAEKVYKKFGHEKRKFLLQLYNSRPVLYLTEAKDIF